MDCKSFADKHAEFIDDTLPGVVMDEMRAHVASCTACARGDADLRRALLLARNLPRVRVSAGFEDRLRTRLASESRRPAAPGNTTGRIRWAASAAALVLSAGLVTRVLVTRADYTVRLQAVVAYPVNSRGATVEQEPAYLASMSTGVPMWPALATAEEGTLRFAAIELRNAALEPSRPHD